MSDSETGTTIGRDCGLEPGTTILLALLLS